MLSDQDKWRETLPVDDTASCSGETATIQRCAHLGPGKSPEVSLRRSTSCDLQPRLARLPRPCMCITLSHDSAWRLVMARTLIMTCSSSQQLHSTVATSSCILAVRCKPGPT